MAGSADIAAFSPPIDAPDVKPPAPTRSGATVRREVVGQQVDVKQVRREFARLTQLFETFPVEWQKRVHEYVQVYKETLSAAGVPKADTKRSAWEFQGALLQQLEATSLEQPPGPSHATDMGAWVGRLLGSVSTRPRVGPGGIEHDARNPRDAARVYVHSRLLAWASIGAVWTKRWSAEWLPSEDALASPDRSCAICLEKTDLRAPMRLACGHEFCARCVAKSVIAAFQGGRACGCPFRCAEWLTQGEVEGLHTRVESLASTANASDSAPSDPASDSASPWASDDEGESSAPSTAVDGDRLNLEEIREHLAVTRALVARREAGDEAHRSLQHHVEALEALLAGESAPRERRASV